MIEHQRLFVVVGQQDGPVLGIDDVQGNAQRLFEEVLKFDFLGEDLRHPSSGSQFQLSSGEKSGERIR